MHPIFSWSVTFQAENVLFRWIELKTVNPQWLNTGTGLSSEVTRTSTIYSRRLGRDLRHSVEEEMHSR